MGESGSSNEESARRTRVAVPKLVEIFGLFNTFNADESGLFWRRLPHRTLASVKRKGKKLAKDHFTVLVTIGADGTKMALLVIGTAQRPRSFPRNFHPYTAWGMPYYINKAAWMTSEIWAKYLRHFKAFVNGRAGVSQDTKVCLLVDNARCHNPPQGARPLPPEIAQLGLGGYVYDNVTVIFFEPNATSVIQP